MSAPSLKLHPFQEDALRICKQKWQDGVTRQLIWLPTGTGKTCVFANLPLYHKFDKRMLVLVHREELALQAAAEFRKWNKDSGLGVGIEMGDRESTPRQKVVIAGVQSLVRRLYRFPPSAFDVIVCDEAHHSAAPTYLRVFDHFGLRDGDNRKLLLGVTATPFRCDDKKLVPTVYQDIIYMMDILQAIEEGWLCDLRSFRIEKTGAVLDDISMRTGDFAEDQLETAIDNPIRNGLIAREWKKLARNHRTIVFAVTVKHAQNLAAAFRDYGVTAKAIWGNDPERHTKISAHREGTVQVLCNCAVLTEGYDDWRIECIVMARPTLSRVLFIQMIGRGTRIERGLVNLVEARRNGLPIIKPECIIIDVVDNTSKHDLVTLPSLFNSSVDFHGKSLKEVREQRGPGEISNPYLNSEELQIVERTRLDVKEVDLFGGARRRRYDPPIRCQYCNAWVPESKLPKHVRNNCPNPPIPCQYCNSIVLKRNLKAHLMAHGRRLRPSPSHAAPGQWKDVKNLVNCPYCRQTMPTKTLQRHMSERCPKRPKDVSQADRYPASSNPEASQG